MLPALKGNEVSIWTAINLLTGLDIVYLSEFHLRSCNNLDSDIVIVGSGTKVHFLSLDPPLLIFSQSKTPPFSRQLFRLRCLRSQQKRRPRQTLGCLVHRYARFHTHTQAYCSLSIAIITYVLLWGYPPFVPRSSSFSKIPTPKIKSVLEPVSDQVKSSIWRLVLDTLYHPTAQQALRDPWITPPPPLICHPVLIFSHPQTKLES